MTVTALGDGALPETEDPGGPQRPPSATGARRWYVLALATAVYAAIATAAFLPTLPLDGSHTQVCTCSDVAQEVWFLAWVPFALLHAHTPFWSNWVLYPSGANLLDNTGMSLLGVLAAPVTKIWGPIAAYNVVLRAAFTLSALAMFTVVRRFVRWQPAAFVAGLVYGFSPFMAAQGLSHEFLVFSPVPPLFLGVLYDLVRSERRSPRRAGVTLGLLFAAQYFIASEVAGMLGLVSLIGLGAALFHRSVRDAATWRRIAGAGAWAVGIVVVILAYPVWFFLEGPAHVVGPPHPLVELTRFHADLLGAVVPTTLTRFAPAFLTHLGNRFVGANLQESDSYLGVPLVLACTVFAIAFRRRAAIAISGVLAVVTYLLSLGSPIEVANHRTAVPGPYALFAHLPVLQDLEAARLALFTALFAAVVLGLGLDEVRERVLRRWSGPPVPAGGPARRPAASAAVLLLAALLILPIVPKWPYAPANAAVPQFFQSADVDAIAPGTVVATYPFPSEKYNQALVWQAEASMRFRILGGTTFFVPARDGRAVDNWGVSLYLVPRGLDALFESAFYGTPLRTGKGFSTGAALVGAIRTDLARYDVGAVVIDPTQGVDPGLAVRFVTAALGRPPKQMSGLLVWLHVGS